MNGLSGRSRMLTLFLVLVAIGTAPAAGEADPDPEKPCRRDPAFAELNFWLGDWQVWAGDRLVGSNRIEEVVGGCALTEHWVATGGGEGMSLFYYDPRREEWNQVWVTEDTTRPGGLKEKRLVDRPDDGALRFQGEVVHPEHGVYLDRTTLIPLADDRVRQLIEISTDDGETWRVVFDALYLRPGIGPPSPSGPEETPR